ncbi:hypothetical protein CLOBOL_07177 [Enterocloster bolteae ATCC BAA-613]|jgi:hypothetical protein|uniref:Uncharacterized protein n=1 Tax=Enterocloster bolteae (strain ATCC BAA-613 / DSM 15670 / CCUG 46953 / JCM 12243 / WAL 16351) TaxID=411902 RepID=A8S5E3_ENTBW|nr:hypothetical protein CLOBOL_07177 [Enterocloster bolteae ATCC BAA-613]
MQEAEETSIGIVKPALMGTVNWWLRFNQTVVYCKKDAIIMRRKEWIA